MIGHDAVECNVVGPDGWRPVIRPREGYASFVGIGPVECRTTSDDGTATLVIPHSPCQRPAVNVGRAQAVAIFRFARRPI